MIDVMFFMTW